MLIPCIIVINGLARFNPNGSKETKVSKMTTIDLPVSFSTCSLNLMKSEDRVTD
jgi:hypothetical protein